jgi:conjugal transfer mating pair stabilization protein TraG
MAFEIWTVGGGYFLYDVFNYLAAIAGHPDLRHMLYIALMATMLFLGMRLALFGSFREVLYWMIAVALVGGLSTAPRARVIIMDTTQPLQIYGTVDNVPFAPAYIGHLTSTVSHYLTERIETLMAQPNDLTYQRTGMLVGATLLAQTARWRAVTPAIHDNLVNFMENCMVDGANLGLLPLEDLGRAGDLPSFIAANVPQALAYYDVATGSTRACADGWPDILAAMGAEVTKVLTEKANAAYQGSNQFGGAANVARMTGTIQDFQNMMGMASANAANHLRHAMMVRALDDGITRFIATSGNDAAMSVYQAARAEAQTRASYSAVGMNATRWVPLLKITFEALYYAAFPLALILMFTPMAWTVIKGYFGGFVWLAAWNPLSAVLHSIVLKAGAGYYREGMSTTANGSTEYVMSWANHFGVQAVEQDVGVIAGYLMMSVPFLATALVFGAQRMSGLATSMLNVSQGAAIETGREAATGAMTLASTSFMMHNWNKLNTSPVTDTGRSSWVMPTGAVQTRNADGSVTYARGSALSDAGLQANASRTLQNELSQHRERAERQVATTGAELSQFIGQSASRYASAGEQLSASQSLGTESAMTTGGSARSEARQAWSRIQDFSREHGLTVEETLRLAGAIEAGAGEFWHRRQPVPGRQSDRAIRRTLAGACKSSAPVRSHRDLRQFPRQQRQPPHRRQRKLWQYRGAGHPRQLGPGPPAGRPPRPGARTGGDAFRGRAPDRGPGCGLRPDPGRSDPERLARAGLFRGRDRAVGQSAHRRRADGPGPGARPGPADDPREARGGPARDRSGRIAARRAAGS